MDYWRKRPSKAGVRGGNWNAFSGRLWRTCWIVQHRDHGNDRRWRARPSTKASERREMKSIQAEEVFRKLNVENSNKYLHYLFHSCIMISHSVSYTLWAKQIKSSSRYKTIPLIGGLIVWKPLPAITTSNGGNAIQVTSFLYALMVGRYLSLLIGQLNRYKSRNFLIL